MAGAADSGGGVIEAKALKIITSPCIFLVVSQFEIRGVAPCVCPAPGSHQPRINGFVSTVSLFFMVPITSYELRTVA